MGFSVGIDVGGTNIKAVLLKKDGSILSKKSFKTPSELNAREFIDFLNGSVREFMSFSETTESSVEGVGIGVPGLVDYKRGVVHKLVNIPGWKSIYLARELRKKLGIKVFVDNDVNAMSLGQLKFGSGRKFDNFLCLTLGTGVGAAIIIDGKLYRGSNFAAGEIGHMLLKPGGRKCNCGLNGCLEAYAGNSRILSDAASKLKTVCSATVLRKAKPLTLEAISRAAADGDKFALDIWEEVGIKIGMVLAGVVTLLDPQAFIIGGGVSGAGKVLFNSLKQTVNAYSMSGTKRNIKILKAGLGKYAGAIGAASLIWEDNKN